MSQLQQPRALSRPGSGDHSMKTDVVKPQGIFFNPVRMVVPLFQRPYVWSKETQWEPLWQDIVRLIEVIEHHDPAATHFLGAIVIQQVPVGLGSLPAWNVIDGQQRLTTLQLLLDALHSELERRGFTGQASRVSSLVENPPEHCDGADDRFKLWPTNRDRQSFSTVMSAPTPVDYASLDPTRLRDAHRYFAESITAWLGEGGDAERRARVLVATVTDRLEIASISLDANEDAQAIFETLNARGTPLSAADLIKNFVFQQIEGTAAERAYFEYWADFETPWWETEVTTGRVKHSRSSLFLWQWLVARTLNDFPIREVFTQFKHYVNTVAKDVALLLPQIKRAADRYRALVEGAERQSGPLSRDELFGYRIGVLDSEVARPLLIWLDEPEQEGIADADRRRILEVLESWFVRRALVKVQSQGSNRFIVDLLKSVDARPKDEVAAAVEEFLVASQSSVGYWPGDDEVREALTGAPAYWRYLRGRLRMVLEALEDHRRGYPDGQRLTMGPIVRSKATIEHLMPQEWRKNWDTGLDEEQEAARGRAIQQLGNLTIVTQTLNSRVSNGGWEAKRSHFRKSDDVLLTRDAIELADDNGGWDESAIEARTEQLIDEILAVWPAPDGHRRQQEDAADAVPSAAIDLAQLVSSGWLEAGTELTSREGMYGGARAAVAQDGRVYIGDVAYDTPSGAGRAVVGRGVKGWHFWRLVATGDSLADIRDRYIASLGDVGADLAIDDEDETR
ncbi:DUF262 domain-containing protein [Microbacterium sp. KUDC0406]|uniref:GmrSD restriction endonuclease domain-containing protein n=1 Tax=Microbacterium sp. KUDC0406 TaxID=2909588 RepID=UPI001F2F3539|nr:DUF262 domain-containing protein [Microbacterium sp. KUDC0406]UJP10116.1 DUF262 domain-containing protein [Microbacterium sp. KUDC0406]